MALSIGSLIGYLELDDTQFARKADQADRKMQALKLNLDALDKSDPKVRIQVDAETAKIDDLRAKITDLKAQSAKGVDVRVKMTQALIDLSAVQAKVRDLTNDEVKIKTEVTGTAESIAKLEALKKKADEVRSGSSFGLGGAAAVFGPMTLPFLTSAAGGLFAMGSGALAAASGLGVLKLALSGFGAASQAYQSYQATMANLHGTPKQQAAQAAAAQITLNKSAYGSSSSPEMQAFVRTYVNTVQPGFNGVKESAQQGALPGITSAMRDLAPILPLLSNSALMVGHSVGTMAQDAARALNTPFWRQFILFIGKDAQRDIPLIGNIFGNLFKGLATGIERFSPQGTSLLTWLDHLSQRFATWTAGPGFASFMSMVDRDATAVLGFLQSATPLITELLKGTDATGAASLTLVGSALRMIALLPTGAVVTLGQVLPPLFLAFKAAQAAGGISGIGFALSNIATKAGPAAAGLDAIGTRLALSKVAAGSLALGVAGLAYSSTSANGAVNVLGDTASGALLGFGLGGPIGAAVGGLAGLIGGGLIAALHSSRDAFHAAKADVQGWANAILQGNQAAAAFANQQVLIDLEKDPKLLKTARAAGLSLPQTSQMVRNGTLAGFAGGKISNLQQQENAVIAQASQYGMFTADGKRNPNYKNSFDPVMQQLAAHQKAIEDQITGYKELQLAADQFTHDSLSAQQTAWIDLQIQSTGYIAALSKLPTAVRTKIDALDIKPTMQAIIDLAAHYHATPKSVQTYLATLGYDLTLKQVQNLINTVNRLDHKHTVKVDADTSAAISAFWNLDATWRSIFSGLGMTDTVINPKTHKKTTAVAGVPIIGKLFAGGGPVVGTGTGTSDSIPAHLSNGEFVVRAAAASRYRGLLESINAAGYANGGAVSASMIRNTSTARSYGVAAWNETHGSSSAPQSVYVVNHGDIAAATERVASHAILNELVFREG